MGGRPLLGEENGRYKTGLAGKGGLYTCWQGMKQRCLNPKHPKYKRYGGRGIKIDKDWLDISGFKEWCDQQGFKEGMTVDRINNDGNYEPENCRLVSAEENSRKKRTTKISLESAKEIRRRLDNGENEYDLAREYKVVHGTIWFIKNNITHVLDGECTKKLKLRKTLKEKSNVQA